MATAAKVFAASLLLAIALQSVPKCSGSAIPIWEFLTRNEKMSYLYSTFAQLVSVHCKATATTASDALPVNHCKRNLLSYGYEKLQTFSDAQLDAFDPYQRGANELIWSSIMRDHPSSTLITTRSNPLPTPPATSLIILTHQKPLKPVADAASSAEGTTSAGAHQQYPQNPLFNGDAEHKHKYAMDMDIAYGYPGMPGVQHAQVETFESNQQQQQTGAIDAVTTQQQQQQQQQQPKTYLTGPLVFRVRPDGTPVEEDQFRPLPRDDDLEAFGAATASLSTAATSASGRPNKHRRIATVSALKQQRLATLALQQQLQPPMAEESTRLRRQWMTAPSSAAVVPSAAAGYFYAKGQA